VDVAPSSYQNADWRVRATEPGLLFLHMGSLPFCRRRACFAQVDPALSTTSSIWPQSLRYLIDTAGASVFLFIQQAISPFLRRQPYDIESHALLWLPLSTFRTTRANRRSAMPIVLRAIRTLQGLLFTAGQFPLFSSLTRKGAP